LEHISFSLEHVDPEGMFDEVKHAAIFKGGVVARNAQ
jgi:hypothetical protein